MTTKVTRALEQVLRQELAAPAYTQKVVQQILIPESGSPCDITRALQQVLIVTEVPPEATAATVQKVIEQALILEGTGNTTAQQVRHQTLIQESPATPFSSGVSSSTLVLIEGPIIETRSTQTAQQSLVADLYRGQLCTSAVSSQALIQTEAPTKDPYRAKTTTISTAAEKSFVHPSQVAAPHRLKNTYTFVGLSVAYPERAVSPIRVPSAVNQLVVKAPQVPLNTVISKVKVPASYGSVAQKYSLPNPTSIKSYDVTSQLIGEVAQKKGFTNPTELVSIRHTQQIAVSQGHAATYKPADQVHSNSQSASLYTLSATRTVYQVPPQSETVVNAMKTEVVAPMFTFLNPLDPRLASQIHWNAIKAESASTTSLADPISIFSTETATAVDSRVCVRSDYVSPDALRSPRVVSSFNLGTASTAAFGDPTGFIPGGRQFQIGMQHVYGSQFYQFLPISSEKTLRVMIESVSPHVFRNPIFVSPTAHAYHSKVEVAVVANYGDPRQTKPKRRISSASIVGVTA